MASPSADYSVYHPGDFILVTFSPTDEPSILGIITRVGVDSVEAYLFRHDSPTAVRRSGIWSIDDPRLDPTSAQSYFRGAFKLVATRAEKMSPSCTCNCEELTQRIATLEAKLASLERKLLSSKRPQESA